MYNNKPGNWNVGNKLLGTQQARCNKIVLMKSD